MSVYCHECVLEAACLSTATNADQLVSVEPVCISTMRCGCLRSNTRCAAVSARAAGMSHIEKRAAYRRPRTAATPIKKPRSASFLRRRSYFPFCPKLRTSTGLSSPSSL